MREQYRGVCWLSAFKTFDVHEQSALAQMAVIIPTKRPNERTQQEQHQVDWKRGSRKAQKMIYYLLLGILFQKENHCIALCNKNCYTLFTLIPLH